MSGVVPRALVALGILFLAFGGQAALADGGGGHHGRRHRQQAATVGQANTLASDAAELSDQASSLQAGAQALGAGVSRLDLSDPAAAQLGDLLIGLDDSLKAVSADDGKLEQDAKKVAADAKQGEKAAAEKAAGQANRMEGALATSEQALQERLDQITAIVKQETFSTQDMARVQELERQIDVLQSIANKLQSSQEALQKFLPAP